MCVYFKSAKIQQTNHTGKQSGRVAIEEPTTSCSAKAFSNFSLTLFKWCMVLCTLGNNDTFAIFHFDAFSFIS
ncbi:hypothetical protein CW304_04175 [Bacillus sp. UFRGS-B20]|nr:hypothetical protein CW304_04175 [Bacillus sp. UFRGS-B20]